MVHCPVLGRVPSPYSAIDADLVIKASHTGITFLTQRRYKKRYAGSKHCAVDINGNLFVDAKDLERKLQREGSPGKVKAKKKAGLPARFNIRKK